MMRPHVDPSSSAALPDTERDTARFSAFADTIPDTLPALADADAELEDTQPSGTLPPLEDEAFSDAPTLPGVHFAPSEPNALPAHASVRDGHWDRVLAAVALAVRRVFASHST